MNTPIFDLKGRQDAREAAIKESRQADQKQHADKLLQGIAKIDDNAPNRAIWELTQNACDLTHQCQVTIDYRNGRFAFSHNGKPFTSKTLISLIKQVSSKGDHNSEEIGRFGTGFITTHAFGRKFTIDSLLTVNGQHIRIKDFLIDRTPMDWEGMADKLEEQETNVFKVIENGELAENPEWLTTLTYWPQYDTERNYIVNSATLLPAYIPIVLTINERLVSFTVIAENGQQETYTKTSKELHDGLWKTTIHTNSGIQEVFSLQNAAGDLEVVLPMRSEKEACLFNPSIARVFLYYPLVGTENWGCNFIIHSRRFKPTEPRDGLHLKSNNEQVQPDEQVNRGLIDEASQLIFGFVQQHAASIAHPIYLAPIAFQVAGDKPLLNEYFKGLQATWVAQFKQYALVETATDRQTPVKAIFLHQELLQEESFIPANYDLAQQCWANLPVQHLAQEWTRIINRWDPGTAFTYKTATELAQQIQGKGKLQAISNPANLRLHYEYLLKNQGELFNKYRLLPNIDGEFRLLTALNNKVHLTPALIDIAKVIAPDIPGKHIHEDFTFQFQLPAYKRSDYAKDITAQITQKISEKAKAKDIQLPYFHKVLDYCRIARTADSTSAVARMAKLINAHYDYTTELMEIPAVDGEDIDNRTAQKRMLQVFLNDIANREPAWVEANLSSIEEVIETMSDLKEYYELLQTAKIFPNKLHELSVQTVLKVDRSIPTELKTMYDTIIRPDKPIDSTLVHDQFATYLTHKEERAPKSLGIDIENKLSEDGQYNRINEHPFQSYILRIIELMTSDDNAWTHYFPSLAVRKANIMLDRVSGDTKGSMFKILSLPADKLNALSQLVEKENLDLVLAGLQVTEQMKRILDNMENLTPGQMEALEKLATGGHLGDVITLGLSAWDDKLKKAAEFEFKHAIGKRIETLIKDKVDAELTAYSVEVSDEQNGQDIVIRKGATPVFYIEVKSKWKVENAVTMSQNQCKRAAENKDIYSLCYVNMAGYESGKLSRYMVDKADIIFDRISFINHIGYELEPLVQGVLQFTERDNDITLTDGYRATIHSRLINSGIKLDGFMHHLITQKLGLV